MNKSFLTVLLILIFPLLIHSQNRGEVGRYGSKFIWVGTGETFIPNYIMFDVLPRFINPDGPTSFQESVAQTGNYSDLRFITEENLNRFIDEFMLRHGFNGIHVPVFGQWFHIGDNFVTEKDTVPDPETFEKLALLINRVYEAGGSTYIWLWGDHQRKWTSKSTRDGIMGKQEKLVLDMIAEKLGPLNGWYMGYGFDLWEWVNEQELKAWHEYMWAKPGWNKLIGARGKGGENQIYEGMDFSSYEIIKPWSWYDDLVRAKNLRPLKPVMSGDRYRIRRYPPSNWREKDYNEEETRRGLWHHAMAGGIAAIWGNLDSSGVYSNRKELKCFSIFWNDHKRFRRDMVIDNSLTNGYCLRESDKYFVYYKEETDKLEYSFSGKPKKVVVVDTKNKYHETILGVKGAGSYVFTAPYISDWAIAVEEM